ncbi:hypothetical protein [Oceanibaculum indicum]|uniref:Uncharacterized protein n=1 Tax=Oceanibaculum indicum P24 TaxID=1207063 RepID=K2J751_9PROT|nr:hypothetical protein [Oceanibaculum indicum]EKE70908.1 hypothetical protein P24_15234 [Oceanibaculum indicum P24]
MDDIQQIQAAARDMRAADPAGRYAPLLAVLMEAYEDAATGKGLARHDDGKPFLDQPMMAISRRHGLGHPLGQAEKKIAEAHRLARSGEAALARRELVQAMTYIAGAVLLIDGEGG